MNYIKITKFDTANGPGIRTVLWVAGCPHHCKGCHNPETWNPNEGEEFTQATIDEILESLDSVYISGLTISGGDPLHPFNRSDVKVLIQKVRSKYPEKSIWLYTGYTFEELLDIFDHHVIASILLNIDVLVEGRFLLEKRDITLPYCGSKNQRVIDMNKTLQEGKIILY